jgi:glutamyl-Q tRNA(Asp) synthetase
VPDGRALRALRVRTDDVAIAFDDLWQGRIERRLAADYGDFVVRRADGLFAYQLAVVVDDDNAGITEVVRGADLLESTARQIYLQRLLGLPTPRYAHLPVALDATGAKLSKQSRAAPVERREPLPALLRALGFLGQRPPAELADANLVALWRWAIAHWDAARVPRERAVALPAGD